jgi:hypothetical protein
MKKEELLKHKGLIKKTSDEKKAPLKCKGPIKKTSDEKRSTS